MQPIKVLVLKPSITKGLVTLVKPRRLLSSRKRLHRRNGLLSRSQGTLRLVVGSKTAAPQI